MSANKKDRIRALLKGIETGDASAVAVVNQSKYIQHNPQTHEGGEGLAALFKRLSKTNPRVNIVRAFEDGDFVFAQTEYDFGSPRVGFEVFRFEQELAVEHWDNIQHRQGPNRSGHSMVDGPTDASDPTLTETNRALGRSFIEHVLLNRRFDNLAQYVDSNYTEHSPRGGDGLTALRATLQDESDNKPTFDYALFHRVLAEGNFVLTVSEGTLAGVHAAFYDLFRVATEKISEHWGTVEAIPPHSEWKNDNGKF